MHFLSTVTLLTQQSKTACSSAIKGKTGSQIANETRTWSSNPPRPSTRFAAAAVAVGLVSFVAFYTSSHASHAFFFIDTLRPHGSAFSSSGPSKPAQIADTRDPSLPRFRISEVREHGPDSENPWVIHGDKVYDITDWVAAHPGGQVILRAAGKPIEPYWDIFSIHKNQYVYDILSQYFIGYVHQADLVDGKPALEQIEDPFADDPKRHASLIQRTAKPCNAETPADALTADFLTPNDLFYVRNHMWVPKTDAASSDKHILTVELLDGTLKEYTLHDLKTKFPRRKVTAALQCSGNRRKHMGQGSGRPANGLQWTAGAISNATWEGVLLADVLADAGFDIAQGLTGLSDVKHVHFQGSEAYGSSIPLKKAIDPQGDVLLAYSMNNEPLPPDHGFPLRALVPGTVAARSVKWLNQITLSEEESMSQWQRRDYKCFGPNETKVDWDAAPSIQELPVQSAITGVKTKGWTRGTEAENSQERDAQDTRQPAQRVSLNGYAISGGGRDIIRVDISLDGGRSWTQARLLPDCTGEDGSPSPCQGHGAWSWKRWRYDGSIPLDAFCEQKVDGDFPADAKPEKPAAGIAGRDDDGRQWCTTVVVKATDDTYNTQPETHAATWNLRGNLATAWHRIQVCTDCSATTVQATAQKAAPEKAPEAKAGRP
ncbi:hypothetical protein HIM_05315 [Hirsutella minnesotensis 3608]|uniref:Nitrate reductase [NADPH] n=1 Tax=Hirsutella minnesotensis 3608 TaxID=1043627 RepID=A0A0F8A5I5_9HYPO|nr:hypothetical protein HIM_05315 [Hirsutella minnesotensis 3608]